MSTFLKALLSFRRIHGMPSPGKCQCWPNRVLSSLVFFSISTHFTAPPEIPSTPIVLQLGSFRRLSRVEPWDLTVDLQKPPTDALRPIILDNACILCLTAAAGIELANDYSSDTIIVSSLGKEVHDPWAFHLHAESGSCLSPNVANHPLRLATDRRLGKPLLHQLANQTRAPPWVDSSFCSSAYGVLAAVSSCCSPPKGRIKLSMRFLVALLIAPFFVDKVDSNILSSQGITCTHSIHMNLEFTSSIAIPALSCQSHEPLMILNRRARIRFRDNQARTDDFHHVKVTLYR
eukprot:Gb_09044 [translate_table: standard]